jgi:hypothetical protein
MHIYILEDEQYARWWPQFRNVVSLRRYDHHQGVGRLSRTSLECGCREMCGCKSRFSRGLRSPRQWRQLTPRGLSTLARLCCWLTCSSCAQAGCGVLPWHWSTHFGDGYYSERGTADRWSRVRSPSSRVYTMQVASRESSAGDARIDISHKLWKVRQV